MSRPGPSKQDRDSISSLSYFDNTRKDASDRSAITFHTPTLGTSWENRNRPSHASPPSIGNPFAGTMTQPRNGGIATGRYNGVHRASEYANSHREMMSGLRGKRTNMFPSHHSNKKPRLSGPAPASSPIISRGLAANGMGADSNKAIVISDDEDLGELVPRPSAKPAEPSSDDELDLLRANKKAKAANSQKKTSNKTKSTRRTPIQDGEDLIALEHEMSHLNDSPPHSTANGEDSNDPIIVDEAPNMDLTHSSLPSHLQSPSIPKTNGVVRKQVRDYDAKVESSSSKKKPPVTAGLNMQTIPLTGPSNRGPSRKTAMQGRSVSTSSAPEPKDGTSRLLDLRLASKNGKSEKSSPTKANQNPFGKRPSAAVASHHFKNSQATDSKPPSTQSQEDMLMKSSFPTSVNKICVIPISEMCFGDKLYPDRDDTQEWDMILELPNDKTPKVAIKWFERGSSNAKRTVTINLETAVSQVRYNRPIASESGSRTVVLAFDSAPHARCNRDARSAISIGGQAGWTPNKHFSSGASMDGTVTFKLDVGSELWKGGRAYRSLLSLIDKVFKKSQKQVVDERGAEGAWTMHFTHVSIPIGRLDDEEEEKAKRKSDEGKGKGKKSLPSEDRLPSLARSLTPPATPFAIPTRDAQFPSKKRQEEENSNNNDLDSDVDLVHKHDSSTLLRLRRSARHAGTATEDSGATSRRQVLNPDELVLCYRPQTGGSLNITQGDLARLDDGEFLNDTLIEFALKLWHKALEAENPALAKDIHVFSSFFYKKLSQKPGHDGYASVRKWTTKFDLFQKKYIIVPINENLHWWLAIICYPGRTLEASEDNIAPTPRRSGRHSIANPASGPPVDDQTDDENGQTVIEVPASESREALESSVHEAPPPPEVHDSLTSNETNDQQEVEEMVMTQNQQEHAPSMDQLTRETSTLSVSQQDLEAVDMEVDRQQQEFVSAPSDSHQKDEEEDDDMYTSSEGGDTEALAEEQAPSGSSTLAEIPQEDTGRPSSTGAAVDGDVTMADDTQTSDEPGDREENISENGSARSNLFSEGDESGHPEIVEVTEESVMEEPSQSGEEDKKVDSATIKGIAPASFYGSLPQPKRKRAAILEPDSSPVEIVSPSQNKRLSAEEIKDIESKPWIITLDSLGSKHPKASRTLAEYLVMEAKDKKQLDLVTRAKWKPAAVPTQPDFFNCGVYLIHFVKEYMKDPEGHFQQVMHQKGHVDIKNRRAQWNDQEVEGIRDHLREKILSLSEEWKTAKALEEEQKKSEETTLVEAEKTDDSDIEVIEMPTLPVTGAVAQKGKGYKGKGKAKAKLQAEEGQASRLR